MGKPIPMAHPTTMSDQIAPQVDQQPTAKVPTRHCPTTVIDFCEKVNTKDPTKSTSYARFSVTGENGVVSEELVRISMLDLNNPVHTALGKKRILSQCTAFAAEDGSDYRLWFDEREVKTIDLPD